MKKSFSIGILLMVLSQAISQVPQSFSYQAVVRDNSGNIVENQNVGVKISIVPEGTYVLPVYSETHSVTTNQFGLFSVKVGEGDPVEDDFGSIRWWEGEFFLQTAVDITGGTNYQVMGSTQLVSVPFALYSQGLIITDENGQSHLVTVDTNGTLSTNQVIVNCGDNFTDLRDGKTYGTVKIGSQCWMSENLNYGQMVLSTVTPSNNGIVEKYCFNDQELSCITTGGYYLWDEAMQYSTDSLNQGICPEGWRIPTDYDLKILEGIADTQYGVGDPVWDQTGWRGTDAGGNLKSISDFTWNSPNTGATNFYGMNFYGMGVFDGSSFIGLKENRYLFSSIELGSNVIIRKLDYDNAGMYRGEAPKSYATSIRCIYNKIYPDNNAPEQPTNPNPSNGSLEQGTSPTLNWTCNDPDYDPLFYNVYFGTENPPALISSNQINTNYEPGQLQTGITYYWKVNAHDYSMETEGELWSFTTTTNQPPSQPSTPSPADQANDIDPFDLVLSWSCSDPENDELVYDVYLGTDNPPVELIASQTTETSIIIELLDFSTTYYWKIIAYDDFSQTESIVWSFTTGMNDPPDMPFNPSPPNYGILEWEHDTIFWSCTDPDNDILTYDIYFGEVAHSFDMIAWDITDTLLLLEEEMLTQGDYYQWFVVAHDQHFETQGDIWEFMVSYPPVSTPENPDPMDGAIDIPYSSSELSWDCTVYQDDYDFELRFGTTNPPDFYTIIQGYGDHTVYDVGQLEPGITYYWKIIAYNNNGNYNEGDIWNFTMSNNSPPNIPANPIPEDETIVPRNNPLLSWFCFDPQNDQLTYDVYYGTSNPPPLVSENQNDTTFSPGIWEANTTYYWKIIADDGEYQTEGDIWSFETTDNYMPNPPSSPSPANADVGVLVTVQLSWQCSDNDNDPLTYDIYFGTTNPPALVASGQAPTTYNPGTLLTSTQYFWKIVASDGNSTTEGDIWGFSTEN